MEKKGRVTGIGGIFFKSENPDKLKKWYSDNLSMKTNEYGATFEFRDSNNPDHIGYLQWSAFDKETTYLDPSKKDFMINYRVENIEELLEDMKKAGIEIISPIEEYEYGKFAHILDPEGNKIELWEPVDSALVDPNDEHTNK